MTDLKWKDRGKQAEGWMYNHHYMQGSFVIAGVNSRVTPIEARIFFTDGKDYYFDTLEEAKAWVEVVYRMES